MTDNPSEPTLENRLTPTQKSRFVQRAVQTHAPLLATSFAQYAADEGITWEELAQSLDCTPEQLDSLAMCRPPRAESFAADVAAIAEGYVEADRLLALLRQIQVLEVFRTTPQNQTALSPEYQTTLLAAQDREPPPESQNPNE